ncbi:AAA family ATPase [Candidatus Dependentiae bacterium]|nr:AAA family ATPase [Candidatus Dependentiae bacterium]
MQLDEVLSLISSKTGFEPKTLGKGFIALCPAHEDKNPSLSITEGDDGKILMKCHAGCSFKDICSALGIEEQRLFPKDLKVKKSKSKRTYYTYKDEKGNPVYAKFREYKNGEKTFCFVRRDKNKKPIYNKKGCRNLLYNLPEVINGICNQETIYLVEGEKDADNLLKHNLIATTTDNTNIWEEEFTKFLKYAHVVILYDYDKTGFKRRNKLCKALYGKVKSLKLINLPGLKYKEKHGEDISDWLEKGNSIQDLLDLTEKTPPYMPKTNGIQVVSMEDFLNMKIPEREIILNPFLPSQGLALLYAKRGVGKTHVALGIAYAVASGSQFLKWNAPVPKKVLYIDGEMPAILMQERLNKISKANGGNPPAGFLNLITPDLQEYMPDLSTEEGQDSINNLIKDNDLIIVDNISTLFRCGIENDAESWAPVQKWALSLRRKGKSVLFVHHAGKSGKQRGTSKKEDILDTVIQLEHPLDYKPDEGARFEIHFEKARSFYGEDAAPFQAHLKNTNDNSLNWIISEITIKEEIHNVAEMKKNGKTIAQITKETGLTKSQVETRSKKAKELGLFEG